ncbi:MAG: tyrosine-type recombinase/integrase [Acidobacteriaceae bacterium]
MAKIRARTDSGMLFMDFYYRGTRCRELTALPDTAENRKKVQALLNRIQKEISQGMFDYAATFPSSPRVAQFAVAARSVTAPGMGLSTTPLFSEFAEQWFVEMSPQWRRLHQVAVREVLNRNLLPCFGKQTVGDITKADVLAFRAEIAKLPGRGGRTIGNARINKIMCFLRQILNEGADRFDLKSAFRGIKPLKQKKTDVQPFSLAEVNRLLATVRPDYRNYLITRFFTGMRSGEINGLQWKYVDLEHNVILVRETLAGGEVEDNAKNTYSIRDIPMLPNVREAIESQMSLRDPDVPWVFATRDGGAIDANNFANRIWYPLLRYLELDKRRPYQTRHTAATLMLAAGENPEWVAKVLGHANTNMLFQVYSRFVPNLTRQDGRAFAGLINSHRDIETKLTKEHIDTMDAEALRRELKAALSMRERKPHRLANEQTRH